MNHLLLREVFKKGSQVLNILIIKVLLTFLSHLSYEGNEAPFHRSFTKKGSHALKKGSKF